jgi:hypothetical protein
VLERMQSLSLQEVYMPFRYVPGLALIANDVVLESVENRIADDDQTVDF